MLDHLTTYSELHANSLFPRKATPKSSTRPTPRYTARRAFCIAALFLLARRSDGTTVAIIYSPTQIVIAADTLFIRSHKVGASTRFPVCKLRNVGDVFFVSIGVIVDNPDTNFSLNDLGEKAVLESKGVTASAQQFMKIGEAPIRDTISWVRKNNPAYYNAKIKGVRYPLGVVFAGFDSGQPVVAEAYFSVEEKTATRITVASHLKVCPSIVCPDTSALLVKGQADAFKRYTYNPSFSKADVFSKPVDTARKAVEIEADDDPADVGRPIDIATIYPNRHACNEKGGCDCK